MSIGYYDKNAKKYIRDTLDVNMSELYDWFLEYLPEQGTILDIGCGSGRDSKYFQEKGYEVYAHDGSVEMVRHAQRFIGKRAVVCRFDEFTPRNCFRKDLTFDGIWACSSLLHVIEEKLPEIIDNYLDYLKEDGVFFMSYKLRDGHYEKDGRWFTNFTQDRLRDMLMKIEHLEIVGMMMTSDVREDRDDEGWISVIVRRVKRD